MIEIHLLNISIYQLEYYEQFEFVYIVFLAVNSINVVYLLLLSKGELKPLLTHLLT